MVVVMFIEQTHLHWSTNFDKFFASGLKGNFRGSKNKHCKNHGLLNLTPMYI